MAAIGDQTPAAITDMAICLADQLIDAFQQDVERTSDKEEITPSETNDEITPDENILDNDVKDDDSDWKSMEEEDVEKEEFGEHRTEMCLSPLGSQAYFTQDELHQASKTNDNSSNVILFTPAGVLNFEDSDGDDYLGIEQKYFTKGDFTQPHVSECMDRCEPEDVDRFTASANGGRADQTQNLRIIEGHDDLDRGNAFIALTMRNHFLQTQVVQLPPLRDDDFLNHSANLYDSLERDDQESHPENEESEDGNENQDNMDIGDGGSSLAHQLFAADTDRNLSIGDADSEFASGHICVGKNSTGWSAPALDSKTQEQSMNENIHSCPLSPIKKINDSNLDATQEGSQKKLFEKDAVLSTIYPLTSNTPSYNIIASDNQFPKDSKPSKSGIGGSIVVTIPSQSGVSTSTVQSIPINFAGGKTGTHETDSAFMKNHLMSRQQRGGPAGRINSALAGGGNNGSQQGSLHVSRIDQRDTRSHTVTSATGRQVINGSEVQRPAVQGSASVGTSVTKLTMLRSNSNGGDGDGDDESSGMVVVAPKNSAGVSVVQSRATHSSHHTSASGNSKSRVSGVGKESNTNRYSSGAPKLHPAKLSDQQSGFRARSMPPPSTHAPSQNHPPPQQSYSHGHNGNPSQAKSIVGNVSKIPQSRAGLMQLQSHLQHEQQRLLKQQKQLQQSLSDGFESPESDHLTVHQPETVITQVGQMSCDGQKQEIGTIGNMSMEVQGMEEVRSRLQNMLKIPKDASSYNHQVYDYADSASDLLMDRPHDGNSNSMVGFRGQEELSGMFESFPSFSYKIFSDLSNTSVKSDVSSQSENIFLREALEKERYRRKHCEQQIQSLNAKLLELQQQLAVAVSTDKRKDIMIDQLDKQLGKVVEGWKKREAEKDEYLRMFTKEKLVVEDKLKKQQSVIESFEQEIANTVEELKQERENSASILEKMKAELADAVHSKKHAEELLSVEHERLALIEGDWEQLKEARDQAESRAQKAQDRLHQEQDSWYQREQDLLHKIDQVKEANLKVMQMERVKLEEQTHKAEEWEDKFHTLQTDVKKLEMELDIAVREKESLKVEMSITEAKYESAQRSLEADLHSQMEKEISTQLNEVHEKMRAEQDKAAEKYRRTIMELHQRHQQELEEQLSSLRKEAQHREEIFRQEHAELESRLNVYLEENASLKQAKQKLESQRMEILSRLQFLMQSQWNEAVSLLVSTPQRKNCSTSLTSSLRSGGFANPVSLAQSNFSSLPTTSSVSSFFPGNMHSTCQQDITSPSSESETVHDIPVLSTQSSAQTSPLSHRGHLHSSSPSSPDNQGVPRESTIGQSLTMNNPVITLEDISAILSQGQYLQQNITSSVHGVMHNNGLVMQKQSRERPLQHPSLQFPQQLMSQTASSSASDSHAVLIQPPQQASHSSRFTDDFVSCIPFESTDKGLNFFVTSDLKQENFPHSKFTENTTHKRDISREQESKSKIIGPQPNQQREQPHHQQRERNMILQDLETSDSESSARRDWPNHAGKKIVVKEKLEMEERHLHADDRNQSMSPPVKQGRDFEQDHDGNILLESDRLNGSYREISRQLEEHQIRQRELQHYIRMLLERPPQMLNEKPERDVDVDPDLLEISLDTIDRGMNDSEQAVEIRTEILRLQQLRERQLNHSLFETIHPRAMAKNSDSNHSSTIMLGHAGQQTGVLPPHQLAEISRLLSQYHEGVEMQSAHVNSASSASQILSFLASLPQQSGPQVKEERQSNSAKVSPKAKARPPRESQGKKKQSETKVETISIDGNLSTSALSERNDKSMSSSSRSASSSKKDKKVATTSSASTITVSAKQTLRPSSKEQTHIWK